MEREKISRKRRGIAVLTLAALFFWYLPQIQVSRQIRKEQEEVALDSGLRLRCSGCARAG